MVPKYPTLQMPLSIQGSGSSPRPCPFVSYGNIMVEALLIMSLATDDQPNLSPPWRLGLGLSVRTL